MTTAEPSIELMRLINGYQVSQALHVAATLGLADQLKDGPKAYDAVAKECGAHPTSLYRLLRALATVGVFHETDNKEFSLTQLGLCLTSDSPSSRRNYAMDRNTWPVEILGAPRSSPAPARRDIRVPAQIWLTR
jgi:hypothetical protein